MVSSKVIAAESPFYEPFIIELTLPMKMGMLIFSGSNIIIMHVIVIYDKIFLIKIIFHMIIHNYSNGILN